MGVAAAFGAPIGGLLFAYEELATFFSQTLGWEVFFACMLSVLTEDTLRSAQNALTEGHFGLFDGEASTIFFEVRPLTAACSTLQFLNVITPTVNCEYHVNNHIFNTLWAQKVDSPCYVHAENFF